MIKNLLSTLVFVLIIIFSSCGDKKVTPWDSPLSYFDDNIKNYHEASLGTESKEVAGNQAVYVDFSDGLVQAYTSETNKKLVDYISQKMVGSSIDWYGLGKNHNGVGKLEFSNDRDIYNKVIEPSSYVDIMAPIEEALKKITASANDALLITDFEEYTVDGKEQPYAYAKSYFTKWVDAGNSITIYFSKYTEKNSKSNLSGEKNLYFVLFNYGEINENSLISKFNKAIEGRNNELIGLNKFEINPNPFSVSNNYGGQQKTGLTLDSDIEPTTALEIGDSQGALLFYQNGFLTNARPFEAFNFGMSLNDLYEFYFKGKRRFAKGLILNASNNSSYILKNVKVQVTDVTADYQNYIKSLEAKKNVPILENDEGNNKVWSKADAENPIILECYEKNTNKLKNQYIYKYSESEPLSEIFEYDATVFSDRLKNSPNEVELITTFHKNFTGKLNHQDQVILRVDYIVESTDENFSNQLDSFKWKSIINSANGDNSSLYESIRNTLQTVKPKGILYSYYLKTEPIKN